MDCLPWIFLQHVLGSSPPLPQTCLPSWVSESVSFTSCVPPASSSRCRYSLLVCFTNASPPSFPLHPQEPYFYLRPEHLSPSESSIVCVHAQSCSTLCYPMDCSSPGSSVRGILQARILEWVAMSCSRVSLMSPALVGGIFLPLAPPGKPTQALQNYKSPRSSLVVRRLRLHTPNAGPLDLIPEHGTRSHMAP